MRKTVLHSIEEPNGGLCVDLFRRPDGSHGFEVYRRDSEDARGWYPIGGYYEQRYADETTALGAAIAAQPWLEEVLRTLRRVPPIL